LHVVVVIAVVIVCLPCFGLSLDYDPRLTASGGLPPRPDLLSSFVLSILSLLCRLHEIW